MKKIKTMQPEELLIIMDPSLAGSQGKLKKLKQVLRWSLYGVSLMIGLSTVLFLSWLFMVQNIKLHDLDGWTFIEALAMGSIGRMGYVMTIKSLDELIVRFRFAFEKAFEKSKRGPWPMFFALMISGLLCCFLQIGFSLGAACHLIGHEIQLPVERFMMGLITLGLICILWYVEIVLGSLAGEWIICKFRHTFDFSSITDQAFLNQMEALNDTHSITSQKVKLTHQILLEKEELEKITCLRVRAKENKAPIGASDSKADILPAASKAVRRL